MRMLLLLAALVFGAHSALGQTASSSPGNVSAVPKPSGATASVSPPLPMESSTTATKGSEETALLKQQVQVMRDYHASLLDTVYWALTAVVTVALILAGFSWWSTFSVYESKLVEIERRLISKLEATNAEAARHLDAKLHEQLIQMSTTASDLERSLVARQDSLAANLSDSIGATERALNEKSAVLLAQLTQRTSEQEARVEARGESLLSRFSTDSADIRARLLALDEKFAALGGTLKKQQQLLQELRSWASQEFSNTESELRSVEEHVWILKRVPNNIAITQSQMLTSALGSKVAWRLEYTLERIKNTLEDEFLEKGAKLSAAAFNSLESALDSAASELAKTKGPVVLVGEVQALLKRVEREDEEGNS